MEVRVKLYAGLTRSAGVSGQVAAMDLPEGSTVADLVAALDIAPEKARLTFVNGRARRPQHRLAPGDQVGVFPPIGGG
jgi:molybdopterin converting factor small subunit